MILNDTRDDESYPKSLLKINGHDLKNVKTFCYLGSRIKNDEPTTGDFEIEARINLAKGKFESLKYILCNQKIYMWIRMMFFNAFVRSRMTYACQTWTLTAKQMADLNTADAYLKRRMIRNGFKRRGDDDPENATPLAYFYSNSDVYKFCRSKNGIPSKPLSEFINQQRQKFTAHTIRQPNSRHTKQLLFNDDQYRRSGNHSGSLLEQVAKSRQIDKNQFIREARSRKF